MRRTKSLVYPLRPHPNFVRASLVEFVRRRIHDNAQKTSTCPIRSVSGIQNLPRRRSLSTRPKCLQKTPPLARDATTPKTPRNGDTRTHGLDFPPQASVKSSMKDPRHAQTCCWRCRNPVDTTFEQTAKTCRNRRRRPLSCPVAFEDGGDETGRNDERRKSCSFPVRGKEEKAPYNTVKDVVKYSFSFGITIERKVKARERKSSDCAVHAEHFVGREDRRRKSYGSCPDFATSREQNCDERRGRGSARRWRFFTAKENKQENHRQKDASPVRLRRTKTGSSSSKPKPRPTSDTALFSNKRRGDRIIRLYDFDGDFNPVEPKERGRSADNTMKTVMSKKPVRILLLNNDSVVLVFDAKASVQQLFDQVCTLLSVKEQQFFGLSTVVENEKRFMELKHKVARYAPKEWGKEIKRRASDIAVTSAAVLTVQFRVQFYVEHPKLISDKISRHLYYLQIKKNILQSRVLTQDEVLITLVSYALQVDFGDHNPAIHKRSYFRPEDYFPAWFVEKWGRDYLLVNLPSLHAEQNGRTAFEAQALYIQQASTIDDVPVHYYELFKNKKETKPSVRLGIFHQGIRIHYGNPEKANAPWKLEFEFMWNKVGRLFFTGKRFEIYPEDLPASRRLTYYTGSHARSKYLLHFLRETHAIFMSLSPYAQQMRRVDGKRTKRKYRESYISGKNLNLESADVTSSEQQSTDNEEEVISKQEKEKAFKSYYQSMTSHGSSHTSGIESDSKQRTEGEDEEDEDHYTDDFDLIEVDHRKESVNVTEDHLAGPPPKSLSVNNLTNTGLVLPAPIPRPLYGSVIDVKTSNKPSRDSTLTGQDLCIPSVLPIACENNNTNLKTPKYSSMSSEDREDTLKAGVPLEVLMKAAMKNKITEAKTEESSAKEKKTKRRESGTDATSRTDRKQVRSYIDTTTQTAAFKEVQPNDKTKYYYDDFHTVPRKPRVRSHTEEPPYTAREPRNDFDTKRHHHRHSRHSQNQADKKKSTKRSSSSHPPAYKTQSVPAHRLPTDSVTWVPSNKPIERTHSSDQSVPAFATGGEKVHHRHGRSVNSIPSSFQGATDLGSHKRNSAFVTVTKPMRPTNDMGYYTVARGYDKYVYYDDVKSSALNGSVPKDVKKMSARKEKKRHSSYEQFYHTDSSDNRERLSSFDDENFSQKMSEACMRTLSAQRRKLSDSKFAQRMDSGRGSLRTTTDDSSSCLDVSPTTHMPPDFIPSPHTSNHGPAHYDLLRMPYIESYNEVIV